ncbi:MAG TPA: hypothetical protein VMW10_03850 [Alphaproteobacteria bacterium]|nr:hypothetical protein [Alphaproteobacteria bacterium]
MQGSNRRHDISDQTWSLLEAEERAAKLPALLSLPMMIFIFPCIYIVIIGLAAIKVMEVMAH